MRLFSAQEILWSFTYHSANNRGHVTFAMRGLPYGYVKIFGPSAPTITRGNCYIAVEIYNGSLTMKETLAGPLRASPRPPDGPRIIRDPLGTSAGPNFGDFSWGITPEQLCNRYKSADDIVEDVVSSFGKTGVKW